MRRIALDGVDQIGDQVGTALQSGLDIRFLLRDLLLQSDEAVVAFDRVANERHCEHRHDNEDDMPGFQPFVHSSVFLSQRAKAAAFHIYSSSAKPGSRMLPVAGYEIIII